MKIASYSAFKSIKHLLGKARNKCFGFLDVLVNEELL